jgi:hypothetical protein
MAIIIAGLWLAFAATHIGLSSSALRPRLVSALGATRYQGLFSLVALAIFVPLCWLYFAHQHAGPHLWYFGHLGPLRWLSYAGMVLAFSLLIGGVLTPSPAGLTRTSPPSPVATDTWVVFGLRQPFSRVRRVGSANNRFAASRSKSGSARVSPRRLSK